MQVENQLSAAFKVDVLERFLGDRFQREIPFKSHPEGGSGTINVERLERGFLITAVREGSRVFGDYHMRFTDTFRIDSTGRYIGKEGKWEREHFENDGFGISTPTAKDGDAYIRILKTRDTPT